MEQAETLKNSNGATNGDANGETDRFPQRCKKGEPHPRGGRPPNSATMTARVVEKMLARLKRPITAALIRKAIEGDPRALQLTVDRLLPASKEARAKFPIPEITDIPSATAAMSRVMAGMSRGQDCRVSARATRAPLVRSFA